MKNTLITLTILSIALIGSTACSKVAANETKKPIEKPAANTVAAEPEATPKRTKAQIEKDLAAGVKSDDYEENMGPEKKSDGICDVYAYVIDKDPAGLNIRDSFDRGKVIGKIPRDEDGTMVHLISTNFAGWVQIDKAETVEGKVVFNKKGWVAANLLGTATTGYDGQGIELTSAGPGTKVVTILPPETEMRMFSCDKTSVRIKYKNFTGWLDENQACPNPFTNCN